MVKKLSFKEYINSKTNLLNAVHLTPQQIKVYTIKRYCRLMVGESLKNKTEIVLKPKQTISIRWIYENLQHPIPLAILIENKQTKHTTYWSGDKLNLWIQRNCLECNKF